MSFEASSSAKSPSFLATFDRSIILLITAPGSITFSLKANEILFKPIIKSFSLLDAKTPAIEPPIVMITEGKS